MTAWNPSWWLRRKLDVRPGETGAVAGLFGYFFVVMAAGYIILPLKISKFLKDMDLRILPIVLFGTAVAMSLVASVNSRLLQKLKPKRYVQASLMFFIAGLAAFSRLENMDPPPHWIPVLFWFWAEMFLAVSVIQFWILVNDCLSPRRVKRFIGLFIGGGLLGGIAGSVLTRFVPTPFLLILCIGFLFIALSILRSLPESRREEAGADAPSVKAKVGYLESLRTLVRNRYLLLLSGMMLAAFGASAIINFQFNFLLKARVADIDPKTYVAAFNSVLLIASTLLHVLFTSRLLKTFGLKIALFVSPVILGLGAASGWLVPAGSLLLWATLLRGTDKSLSHSLSQSTREILYIPVPTETRQRAKVFIDLFVNKLADALAAFFLFIAFTLLGLPVRTLSALTLAFLFAWAVFNRRILIEYVGIIRKNLMISRPDADQLVLDHIDVNSTKLVFDTLESRNRSSVLYAMNLLDLVRKDKLTPELRAIIAARSSEVRAGSFDALLDVPGETLVPEWDDALDDADLGKEVQEVLSLDVYQTVMRDHIQKVAEARGETTDPIAQMEVAKALGMMNPDAPLVDTLRGLLKRGSPEVVRYALESAGRQAKREFIPLILPHLGRSNTAEAAAVALVESGDRFAGMIDDALRDAGEDIRVRRAIPGVLARMGSRRAADILAAALGRDDPSVLDETIEALFRLRTKHPETAFEESEIRPAIMDLIRKACSLVLAVEQADRAPSRATLAGDLGGLLSKTVKQIFELLSLIYPHEDIVRAYQNYQGGRKKSVDFALELLEAILRKDLKDVLLPLLEDHPPDEQARIARRVLKSLEP